MNIDNFSIELKQSTSHWKTIGDAKFFIDYASIQGTENELLPLQLRIGKMRNLFTQKENESDDNYFRRYADNRLWEIETEAELLMRDLCLLYIKHCIKDWENVNDKNGKPVKCLLTNNVLDKDLLDKFTKNMDYLQLLTFYKQLLSETEFTETDKKKL
jgi:hypothetical protein